MINHKHELLFQTTGQLLTQTTTKTVPSTNTYANALQPLFESDRLAPYPPSTNRNKVHFDITISV